MMPSLDRGHHLKHSNSYKTRPSKNTPKYWRDNTVSPFNTQTNPGDLTEYDYQASLNQVIIILLINKKPVLCLNKARL